MEIKVGGQVISTSGPKAVLFSDDSANKGYGAYCDRADVNATISVKDLKARFGDGVTAMSEITGKPNDAMIDVSGELVAFLWILPKNGAQRGWLIQEQDDTPNA